MRSRYCLQQLRGAVIHTVLASLTPPELALSARLFPAYGFDAGASISLRAASYTVTRQKS